MPNQSHVTGCVPVCFAGLPLGCLVLEAFLSLSSREKILPKAVPRVTWGTLRLPWEEGREKGALAVNFLTPDGSVV